MQRRWHFLLAHPLEPSQESALRTYLTHHLREWKTHGRPISWNLQFPYQHFIEITAYGPVSGCATDTLFRTVQEASQICHIPLLKTEWIAVVKEGKVFVKKFYEIIKEYSLNQWDPTWQILEPSEEGIQPVSLTESRLAIHLSK
ncbi:MAG: hypothetical protein N2170_00610 [Bacteroidia bacterium]|nr:hypothetical protein [Bacteroidia bacterium]